MLSSKNKLQASLIVPQFLYSALNPGRFETTFSWHYCPDTLGFWFVQKIFFVVLLFFSSSAPVSSVSLGMDSRF